MHIWVIFYGSPVSTFRYDSETDLSVGQEIKVERLGKFRITKVHKNEGSHVHSAAAKKIDPA